MINFANDIEDMQQKQITATYAEAVKAIKEAILESRYRAARLVNKEVWLFTMLLAGIFPPKAELQDGAAMLLALYQNCCNRNCLG